MTFVGNSDVSDAAARSDSGLTPHRGNSHGYAAGGAVRVAGRVLLWACVALVFVRGLGAIASTPSHATSRSGGAAFPSAEAGVFATRFADAYLSFSPGQTTAYQQAVSGFLARGLSDQTVLPSSGQGVSVTQAMVAREQSLDDSRAILTVAAVLSNGQTRYLAVPVAEDKHDGLDVFALPSLVAAPAAGTASDLRTTAVPAVDSAAVTDLVHGFLTAYLSDGQGSSLSTYLTPGTILAAMPSGLSLASVGSIGVVSRSTGRLVVQADVSVSDSASGAVYDLAYRLTLTQGKSGWRVAGLAGGPQS